MYESLFHYNENIIIDENNPTHHYQSKVLSPNNNLKIC